MLQFQFSIDPIVAPFGPLALPWYSLAIGLAIAMVVVVAQRELRRKVLMLQPFDAIVFEAIPSGIVGALLTRHRPTGAASGEFGQDPGHARGRMAIYGAVAGRFAVVAPLSRLYHFPFLPVIDAIAPGLALAQAVGRLDCIVNSDACGTPTNRSVAFVFTNPSAMLPQEFLSLPTHPYSRYDIAINPVNFFEHGNLIVGFR